MTELPDLKQLDDAGKIALIESLWEEIQKLRKAAERRPKKTAKNSSLPPSQGFKPNLKPPKLDSSESSPARGGGRPLSEHPDTIVKAEVTECEGCGLSIPAEEQSLLERYDKIEIPPIRPVITRVERYGCPCPGCGKLQIGTVPESLLPSSPFGPRLSALVTTLRYTHAISYRRLERLLADVFGLNISQGGIANLLKRVKTQLQPTHEEILGLIRQASILGSDETSARVSGQTQWEWVFQNGQVCLHVIRPSRGADVIADVLGDHCPETWVSDLFSAQLKHPAAQFQVCLAHQLRDCQYAIDAGDDEFAPKMKRLILKAIAIDRRWDTLAESTQSQYLSRLKQDLADLLKFPLTHPEGIKLQTRYRKRPESLLLFVGETTIPPTNNASEQALRWSVIFRKVTNGFRSEWGRDLFADIRSIFNTGARQGLAPFQSLLNTLDPTQSLFPLG
jgi:transposase